jgi:hypothetical protein
MVDLGDNKNRKEGMKIVFIRLRKAVLLDRPTRPLAKIDPIKQVNKQAWMK